MRARPPARRAAMRHVGTPRPPLRAALGHGENPIRVSPLALRARHSGCRFAPLFCRLAHQPADRAKRVFPYGAVAHSLPPFLPCRVPAVSTPFLSRAGREGCAYRLEISRSSAGAVAPATSPPATLGGRSIVRAINRPFPPSSPVLRVKYS